MHRVKTDTYKPTYQRPLVAGVSQPGPHPVHNAKFRTDHRRANFQQHQMSTPHPPTSSSGTVEQTEPAWNPGGRNLSYINKTGRRKFGVIGVLLSLSPIPPQSQSLRSVRGRDSCAAFVFCAAFVLCRFFCFGRAVCKYSYVSCYADNQFCAGDMASLSSSMEEGFNRKVQQ